MGFWKFWQQKKLRIKIKSPTGDDLIQTQAFIWRDQKYFMIENAFEMRTGRALCAITYYEEFRMRCDHDYLTKHCRAIDILLSDPKKISIGVIAILHENLKERVNLAPYPDHIYKLASVMFYDDSESPFSYDFKYNQEKIKRWKEDPDLLPFLVSTPLRELMPFGEHAKHNLETFLQLKESENQEHLRKLDEILSKTP